MDIECLHIAFFDSPFPSSHSFPWLWHPFSGPVIPCLILLSVLLSTTLPTFTHIFFFVFIYNFVFTFVMSYPFSSFPLIFLSLTSALGIPVIYYWFVPVLSPLHPNQFPSSNLRFDSGTDYLWWSIGWRSMSKPSM
jgi:hypothetical protein